VLALTPEMRCDQDLDAQRHRSSTGGLHGHAVKIAAAGAVRRPLLRMLVRRKHLKACSGSRGCARRCRTNGYNSVGLPDEVNKHCIAHRGRKRERQGGSAQLPGNAGGFANCVALRQPPLSIYRKLCRSDAPGSPAPGRAFGRRLVARGADLDPSRPWSTLQIFKSGWHFGSRLRSTGVGRAALRPSPRLRGDWRPRPLGKPKCDPREPRRSVQHGLAVPIGQIRY
jgi:hypothetical protein